MSYIGFVTECGEEAKIRGFERAWMGCFIADLFCGLLPSKAEDIAFLLPKDHYLQSSCERHASLLKAQDYYSAGQEERLLKDSFLCAVRVGMGGGDRLRVGPDEYIPAWQMQLNTAKVLGSRPVQLFAKLHGQCEIHCFVEERNRSWMADIIEEGLEISLYRASAGWAKLVEFLRNIEAAPGPVVCEYSVCDSFPHLSDKEPNDEDDWPDRDWKTSMEAIKKENGLEISPDTLGDLFGAGKTIFDLYRREQEGVSVPTPTGK